MGNMKDINDRIRADEFSPANFEGDTDKAKCLAANAAFRIALEQEFADTTWNDETLDALWSVVHSATDGLSWFSVARFYEKCANLVALGFNEGERRQWELSH